MPFMEPEITNKMRGFEVETTCGTVFLPGDVCDKSEVSDFVEGRVLNVRSVHGYFGRYQAPGYLDCTDWEFDTDRRRLVQMLDDLYGDEDC